MKHAIELEQDPVPGPEVAVERVQSRSYQHAMNKQMEAQARMQVAPRGYGKYGKAIDLGMSASDIHTAMLKAQQDAIVYRVMHEWLMDSGEVYAVDWIKGACDE